MFRMFRKIPILFLMVSVLFTGVNFVEVSAERYGNYECTVSNDEITINRAYNVSGLVELPAEINGMQVKHIGSSAFQGNTGVEEVVVPESVISIGNYAFRGCTGLLKIVIYNTLESIGMRAFESCNALREVEYRGTEEEKTALSVSAGNNIFLNASFSYIYNKYCGENIVWTISNGKLSISETGEMFSWDSEEDIPWFEEKENINEVEIGDEVTNIGKNAFKDMDSLEKVTIGNAVCEIEESAFEGCTSLSEVQMGTSVKTIGNNAFKGCEALGEIDLSYAVEKVDNNAFENCTSLNTVYIGDSVKQIGDFAFGGCDNIQNANYPLGEEKWNEIQIMGGNEKLTDNIKYYFGRSGNCGNNVTWVLEDNGKLKIEGEGEMSNFESPYDENIPWSKFSEDITEIEVNSINIGDYAFAGLYNVQNVLIADHISDIGKGAFSYCMSLESIRIPENVHTIKNEVFAWCEHLSEIEMPEQIQSIGKGAFLNCKNLNTELPDEIKIIGDEAFCGCENLGISELRFSESIGKKAFSGCINISRIIISPTLINIGENAFENTEISQFEVASNNAVYTSLSGNLYNKNKSNLIAYANGKSDTEFVVPSSVTEISKGAFTGNEKLEKILIDGSLKTIGDHAFSGLINLREIEIPVTVTNIGVGAFEGCVSLKKIDVPDAVTNIGIYAFAGCENLEEVTMGDGIISLSDNMFRECRSLKNIPVGNNTKRIGENTFTNALSAEYITIPEGITEIGNYAFEGCASLKGVTLNEGLLIIGEGAFKFCHNLIDITIPDSVTSLDKWAFAECENISAATLGTGIRKLEEGVFDRCANMTNITIPKEITEFGDNACGGCENVKTVYYSGTPQMWSQINKGDNNLLTTARRKYIRFVTFKDSDENVLYKAKTYYNIPILLHIIPVQGDNIVKLYTDKGLTNRYDTTDDTPVTEDLTFYIRNIDATKTLVSDESDSLNGETIFNVKGLGLKDGSQVILALYNNEMFVGLETAEYQNGGIVFRTDLQYTSAKVMVWKDNKGLKPLHECENVKQSQ